MRAIVNFAVVTTLVASTIIYGVAILSKLDLKQELARIEYLDRLQQPQR